MQGALLPRRRAAGWRGAFWKKYRAPSGGGGFGSTWELWRGYRKSSDIDLAMDGGDLMAAMAIVEGSDIPVDVLELSSCRPTMMQAILERGVVLAEQDAKKGIR